jgi:small GTP-binding protein
MKKLTLGIVADVDAGKTTLSEAMLFISGTTRKMGRVDSGNAFLDTHELEKQRGITIFAKQAVFELNDTRFYLVDTPGHADFSAETERALTVLDCAVLLISSLDGAAAHTETLWRMLRKRGVPTVVFVNKTDLAGFDKAALMDDLHKRLGDPVIDFSMSDEERDEAAAMCDEALLEAYDGRGCLSDKELAGAFSRGNIFPCLFGSALKNEGVKELLDLICRLAPQPVYGSELSAAVFKIDRDKDGKRQTLMKLTGGSIKVRETISYRGANGLPCSEKIARIRIYSGGRFTEVESAEAGDVCAVLGLVNTYAGQGIGTRPDDGANHTEPVVSYAVYAADPACDNFTLLKYLKELQEEDPALNVGFNERLGEVEIRLMGEMQTEVLKSEILRRFGVEITVGAGRVLYRETISNTVEGVGHFEPLRHYAEVHLILEPLKRGSGIIFASSVSEDLLDKNWQNLIISSLKAKEHIGVLTGSPITDMKITLSAGRAHPKHTEGGDFREAAWRALRQGLMKAESVLLEPFFSFTLTVPAAQTGRAMNDLTQLGAEFSQPDSENEFSVIRGRAPAAKMRGYAAELASYTGGKGRIALENGGYDVCTESEKVITEAAYSPEADLENTPDSVFCSHGAGVVVNWREVEEKMHLEPTLKRTSPYRPPEKARNYSLSEDELERIMQKIAPKKEQPQDDEETRQRRREEKSQPKSKPETRPRLLIVDGYNIVFAWEELRELAAVNIDSACGRLADMLINYAGFRNLPLMLVFDAYKTPAVTPNKLRSDSIEIIYTKSGQTSDAYIESFCSANRSKHRITVATNDGLVQLSVMRIGALRMSANELKRNVEETEQRISEIIRRNNT